jgi:hypothetical protein
MPSRILWDIFSPQVLDHTFISALCRFKDVDFSVEHVCNDASPSSNTSHAHTTVTRTIAQSDSSCPLAVCNRPAYPALRPGCLPSGSLSSTHRAEHDPILARTRGTCDLFDDGGSGRSRDGPDDGGPQEQAVRSERSVTIQPGMIHSRNSDVGTTTTRHTIYCRQMTKSQNHTPPRESPNQKRTRSMIIRFRVARRDQKAQKDGCSLNIGERRNQHGRV